MNIIIRKAYETDADKIGSVHYRAWIETYTDLLSEDYLAARSADKSAAMFHRMGCLNLAVAENDGEIIGFCGWGEFRDPALNEHMGEIYGIYVLDAYKRNHIGKRLLSYALEQLKDNGFQEVGLWVLDTNENAIRFYEKMGFEHNGVIKKANLGRIVTELLYTKRLLYCDAE